MNEPSVLAHLTTTWYDPWLVTLLHQQGLRHYHDGKPCEDAYLIQTIGNCLFVGVADGMSSQPRSREGARAALAVSAMHLRHLSSNAPSLELLLDAFSETNKTLTLMATQQKQPIEVFATTLAVALIGPDHTYCANIGDSSILALVKRLKKGQEHLASSPLCAAPQPNNTNTYSIVSPLWRRQTATETIPTNLIEGLIIATDGAQNYFSKDMGYAGGLTFEDKHITLLPSRVASVGPRYFAALFGQYMVSEEACYGDDRTLIVAYKPDPQHAPPKPKIAVEPNPAQSAKAQPSANAVPPAVEPVAKAKL